MRRRMFPYLVLCYTTMIYGLPAVTLTALYRVMSEAWWRIGVIAVASVAYAAGLATIAGLFSFPHQRYIGFCSDYPRIRHAGTPGNRRRQLDMRDSVAINVSLMALAAYLSNSLDHGKMLGAGPARTTRPHKIEFTPPREDGSDGWFSRLLAKCGLKHI